jgi:antagonist of KipI
MGITIVKQGLQDTLQDAGRWGYQAEGVNPSGAMDRFAMKVANILVGNNPDETVIEMHFPASVFLFTQPALIALSGADFSASINGEPIPHLHPVMVGKNDVLQFHKPVYGARSYLAVNGGLAAEKWLGSSSTNLKAGAGGFAGRKLQKPDELFTLQPSIAIYMPQHEYRVLPWKADIRWPDKHNNVLVLLGREWERLTREAKENFCMTSFVITSQSDRMGYRLNNMPLHTLTNEEVVSAAVSFGTIQLLPDGRLIILTADHQTTGGYPRIAHVISAHHSKLAQYKPGDRVQFQLTNHLIAEELFLKQQQHLQQLQNACILRLKEFLHAR